jgi:hypothetical protein
MPFLFSFFFVYYTRASSPRMACHFFLATMVGAWVAWHLHLEPSAGLPIEAYSQHWHLCV